MLNKVTAKIKALSPAQEVEAHCDGPCGVYDPASARITAEAVLSMTKKILDLKAPSNDGAAMAAYLNTMARYIQIKEEQAQETKDHLLVLWTDFFKTEHLDKFPDLHNTFWKAAKLCSACKVGVSVDDAEALLSAVENVHNMFWSAKGRDVDWVLAS